MFFLGVPLRVALYALSFLKQWRKANVLKKDAAAIAHAVGWRVWNLFLIEKAAGGGIVGADCNLMFNYERLTAVIRSWGAIAKASLRCGFAFFIFANL